MIEYAFRRRGGNGPGYGTIVAAGANATILHYRAGDAALGAGELCLVDAGGEYGFYTRRRHAHVPRARGRFSKAQRDAYEVVLAAQEAGIARGEAGRHAWTACTSSCVRRLVEGMVDAGAAGGHPGERVADGSYRKYYMHRTSHWLGMDVHDVGAYHVDGKSPAARAGHGAHGRARPLRGGRRRERARGAARHRGSGSRTTSWSPRTGTRT